MENKLTSRKFAVWVVGCIFVFVSIIITKTVSPELINFMLFNNMFYISANTIQKIYL